jgi:hypothetical protein
MGRLNLGYSGGVARRVWSWDVVACWAWAAGSDEDSGAEGGCAGKDGGHGFISQGCESGEATLIK